MPWVDAAETYADAPATEKEIAQVIEYRRRKAKPRFYADENFPKVAAEILVSMGARLITAQELHFRGHPDENHAAYALKHAYILVTGDRDYLDNSRFPLIHCPAIVIFDFGKGTCAEIRKAFVCLWTAFSTPQFWDKWMKISASPDSWTQQTRHLDGTTSRTRHRLHRGVFQEWLDE